MFSVNLLFILKCFIIQSILPSYCGPLLPLIFSRRDNEKTSPQSSTDHPSNYNTLWGFSKPISNPRAPTSGDLIPEGVISSLCPEEKALICFQARTPRSCDHSGLIDPPLGQLFLDLIRPKDFGLDPLKSQPLVGPAPYRIGPAHEVAFLLSSFFQMG